MTDNMLNPTHCLCICKRQATLTQESIGRLIKQSINHSVKHKEQAHKSDRVTEKTKLALKKQYAYVKQIYNTTVKITACTVVQAVV